MTSDKILILRNQGIGDLILISPSVRAIRELHLQAHISVFVGNWSRPAVEGNPYIDDIISYPDPWIQNKKPLHILSLVAKLRREKFQRAYIFHSHNMLHLLLYLAGIPERYGFSYKGTGKFLTHTTEWQPNTSRYVADNYLDIPRLAGYEGSNLSLDIPLSDEDLMAADHILSEYRISPDNYFLLAPGGGINPRQNVFEKRWGVHKYAELAELLYREFHYPSLLVGAPAEKGLSDAVAEESPVEIKNLCGETDFKTSAALVKNSRALICNDSSIMHTAIAFGTPSVAVFGPSNPRSLHPVSDINRWISSGADCSPCYCNEIFRGCPHNLKCMTELEPRQVLNTLKESLLARTNGN